MRLVIDIRPLMDRFPSGVSEYTRRLLDALLAVPDGNEYVLYANAFSDPAPWLPQFNDPRVKTVVTRYPNRLLHYGGFVPFNRPHIDERLKADVFFIPHLNFIGLGVKTKRVITIHDLSFLRRPELFSARKNLWHRLLRVPALLRRFDTIIAVSHHTKRDLVELARVPEAKVRVIPSGIGEEYRPFDRPEDAARLDFVRKKYALPPEFILALSTIEPRKNIPGLIRAFERLSSTHPGLQLVIAGAWGWHADETRHAIAGSSARERIRLLGYVEREDKPALYALARVFAYPSFYEGFGFPPLESMACGTIAVVGAVASLSETAAPAALMVDPFDAASIAAGLDRALSDRSGAKGAREAGLALAAGYHWDKAAAHYRHCFFG